MPRAIPVGALVVYHDNGPPSTSDDSATIRARRGYWWVDALAGDFWLCVDPAEGAAVWYRLGNAEDLAAIALSGSWSDLSGTPTTLAGYGITDAVPDSRAITAGTGLEGGGDLSEDRTLSLSAGTLDSLGRADSAVQPGDLAAIATSGDWADISGTPTTLSGYGITDAALASDLTSHENDTSNPHGVTASQVGAPPTSRTITAGTGLTGGGDLSANRTISLSTATQNSLALADTAVQPGDLAAIATSGAWGDLTNTPTTLSGYGITDALARASNLADLSSAATARSNLGLGSAAVEDASTFDAAGSAAAVAGDLLSHEQDTNNPHQVTAEQVGADPVGSAAAAENNANSYTDNAISALGSAAHEHVGTQPLELPRNTELASGAFAPYEPMSLWPIVPEAAHTLTPDDSGKIVWSAAHDITLPDSTTPGMAPGWRVWIKNTDTAASLTIDCGASDTLDGGATLTLPAGESRLIALIATGQFGSL